MATIDISAAPTSLSSNDALILLVELLKRLFAHRKCELEGIPLMRRFEKPMFETLERLRCEPQADIDDVRPGVQRLVYEMLSQYVTLYAQSPGLVLGIKVEPNMSDGQKLTLLLSNEVIPRSWPYPQSVPL